jgi:membrane protein YqaA with SNARE-associated domain
MKIKCAYLVILLSCFAYGIFSAGQGIITYQGMVVLPNGQVPPDGKYDMKFSLWNIASGGSEGANEKWEETHSVDNGVNLVKGRFSVQLGGITPFPADLFIKNPNIWLQVQVDLNKNGFEDSEIFLPRVPFTSAPYAFQADNAATADNATNATHATDVLRIVRDFVVDSGESITAGDVVSFINGKIRKGVNKIGYGPEQAFNSGITSRVFATALSDSKFVVAYQDDGNSDSGTAIVGNVSGSTISYGSGYVFNNAIPNFLSAATLSDSKFVVAYSDLGNSSYGTAIVGTLSGSTISFGSEYVFNSAMTGEISVAALSDSKFIVTYRDIGNLYYGTAIVGTVSDSTIIYGSEYVFNSQGTYNTFAAAFSDSKFLIAYSDFGNSSFGTAIVGTVSDTTISYGLEYVFNKASSTYISAAALSDSKFVLAYKDVGNSNYGTAIVGTVLGSIINYGSEYVFNPADTIRFQAVALSDSKFVVAYQDGGNSNYGTAIVGTVLGSMINYGSEYVFRSVSTDRTTVIAFSDSKFAVAYQDTGITGYGMSVIGDFYEPFGIADASASAGANLPVILHGISNHYSSLTPGTVYYGNTDGSLTRTPNAFRIGRAVSDTELLLELGR